MNVSEHPIDRDEVMAYLDGELPAARAALVVAHLDKCRDRRSLAADLREVSRQMATWQVEPAPAAMSRTPMSAAEQPTPPGVAESRVLRPIRWRAPRWALASVAAAAVALFVTIPSLRNRSPEATLRPSVAASVEKLDTARLREREGMPAAQSGQGLDALRVPVAPMMARTATLNLLVDDVDAARARIESLLRERQGYVSELSVAGDASSGRSLSTTLRVPAAQLDAALAALRVLGRVVEESQTGEDVLEQVLDVQARLTNGRVTEERLNGLLRDRTGKVADVLEVEREIMRVRGEIERLDAQRQNLAMRVALAIVQLRVSEAPKASLELGTLPTFARLRNALVDGSREAAAGLLEAAIFALERGPSLLIWIAILFWPARLLWRRFAPAQPRVQ